MSKDTNTQKETSTPSVDTLIEALEGMILLFCDERAGSPEWYEEADRRTGIARRTLANYKAASPVASPDVEEERKGLKTAGARVYLRAADEYIQRGEPWTFEAVDELRKCLVCVCDQLDGFKPTATPTPSVPLNEEEERLFDAYWERQASSLVVLKAKGGTRAIAERVWWQSRASLPSPQKSDAVLLKTLRMAAERLNTAEDCLVQLGEPSIAARMQVATDEITRLLSEYQASPSEERVKELEEQISASEQIHQKVAKELWAYGFRPGPKQTVVAAANLEGFDSTVTMKRCYHVRKMLATLSNNIEQTASPLDSAAADLEVKE